MHNIAVPTQIATSAILQIKPKGSKYKKSLTEPIKYLSIKFPSIPPAKTPSVNLKKIDLENLFVNRKIPIINKTIVVNIIKNTLAPLNIENAAPSFNVGTLYKT